MLNYLDYDTIDRNHDDEITESEVALLLGVPAGVMIASVLVAEVLLLGIHFVIFIIHAREHYKVHHTAHSHPVSPGYGAAALHHTRTHRLTTPPTHIHTPPHPTPPHPTKRVLEYGRDHNLQDKDGRKTSFLSTFIGR